MLNKFPTDKISGTKNALLFLSRAPARSFTTRSFKIHLETDLETDFLNLENRSYGNVIFSIVTIKQIFDVLLLLNLFIPLTLS